MTEKQKIFADEYLIDLNATRAYKVAYPRVKKDETAAQAGSRMLRNVKVAAYIEKPQGKPTLVPESDKRPAMNTAKNDFMEEYDNE